MCTSVTSDDQNRRGGKKNGFDPNQRPLGSLPSISGVESAGLAFLTEASALEHVDPQMVREYPAGAEDTQTAAGSASSDEDVNTSAADVTWPVFTEPTRYEADEDAALTPGTMASFLDGTWRLMLLSDGSVTRHLKLLTNVDKVDVRNVKAKELSLERADIGRLVPRDVALLAEPDGAGRVAVTQREVNLCDGDGRTLVYAASWWSKQAASTHNLANEEKPVWVVLAEKKTELYREVRRVYLGDSAQLEAAWGARGPFWARHYVFWSASQPLCVIYEVFSPALQRYLGPPSTTARAPRRRWTERYYSDD